MCDSACMYFDALRPFPLPIRDQYAAKIKVNSAITRRLVVVLSTHLPTGHSLFHGHAAVFNVRNDQEFRTASPCQTAIRNWTCCVCVCERVGWTSSPTWRSRRERSRQGSCCETVRQLTTHPDPLCQSTPADTRRQIHAASSRTLTQPHVNEHGAPTEAHIFQRTCLNGRTPPYLSDYCVLAAGVDTRQHLRSTNRQLLAVPCYRLNTYGRRAFQLPAPQTGTLDSLVHWNF